METTRELSHAACTPAPLPADHRSRRLAHRADAAAHARRVVRSALDDWQVSDDDAHSVLLVASELVTNALQHAEPPVVLHVSRERAGPQVRVGVTDGGPRKQPRTSPRSPGEHGRGLLIVGALAIEHGTNSHAGRTTRWASLPAAYGRAQGDER
ncbi:ATP-binding protein [Streptomyces sp. NPDC086787]|uniref:ATP-binding protein n=1 Tax=Streptomyces sp. NPDC086787 TaxID=3365759 RepID=UPI0038075DC2